MHGIILVHIIKTFQKVPDNFAFIKNRVITEPNVCPSVCLCDCPSGCLPLRKSAITFDPLEGSARNFQGSLTSSQVIFGRVTWTPGPSGSGPGPKKGVSAPLSPPGVLEQEGRFKPFRKRDDEANKMLGSEL